MILLPLTALFMLPRRIGFFQRLFRSDLLPIQYNRGGALTDIYRTYVNAPLSTTTTSSNSSSSSMYRQMGLADNESSQAPHRSSAGTALYNHTNTKHTRIPTSDGRRLCRCFLPSSVFCFPSPSMIFFQYIRVCVCGVQMVKLRSICRQIKSSHHIILKEN